MAAARPRAAHLAVLAGLAAAALLPNPGAALPIHTYYFRDFTAAFHPLRAFTGRELAAGRIPFWNPYLHEGTFAIPSFHPFDLLLALSPTPAAVSWLLTLQFPIAALGFFWLARELGVGRLGAFVSGSVYAMGGLALSSLNLYVFLQALALAPFVVATLRRSAVVGGRWIPAAALAIGAAVSTLAMEFVAQAILLGLALSAVALPSARPVRSGGARLAAAFVLGIGLAAVPVAVMRGLLPETIRGAGFAHDESLRQAAHPVHLLQALVSGLLGPPNALLSDGRVLLLFGELPYFVTLYVGPFVVAAAAAGAGHPALKRTTRVLMAAGVLGLWVALGAAGGLAPLLLSVPPFEGFRYPSKALFLPYVALALLAGAGVDRLRAGQGWRSVLTAAAFASGVCLAAAIAITTAGERVARALGVAPELLRFFLPSAAFECLCAALIAALAVALAIAAERGVVRGEVAALVVAIVIVADLARAGAFVNPQTKPERLALAPEIAAELRDGGRVFSYGVVASPEFVRCATVRRRGIEAWSSWVSRQVLAPYTNIVDRLEGAATADLTALGPRVVEPTLADLRPEAVGRLLPRLRRAAVSRVLSLDPLDHPGLRLLRAVPLGLEGLRVFVYEVLDPLPREYVACRVRVVAPGAMGADPAPAEVFDERREVALEAGAEARCDQTSVRRRTISTDEVAFDVTTDAPGVLVVRDTFARGWRATVDGAAATLQRAGASYRAVPIGAGRHEVRLRYHAPGLAFGLAIFAAAAAAVAALLAWPRP